MSKIIITGGAGFVGSNTIAALLKEGYTLDDIMVVDIRDCELNPDFPVTKCDITSPSFANCIDEGDKILHLTAIPIYEADPRKIFRVNVEGMINVVQCAMERRAERIVFASSGAVYFGLGDIHPPIDESCPTCPNTYYGYSKLVSEHILEMHKKTMPYIALRYGYIYGRGDKGAINIFVNKLNNNEAPTIFWGKQSVEQVYVKDIAQANVKALHSSNMNQIYNIGTGAAMPIRAVYDMCATLLNKDIEPEIKPLRSWDPPSFWYNINKAVRELGYSPKWTLSEGIKDMLKEMKLIKDVKDSGF